jgi:hypothetical protein
MWLAEEGVELEGVFRQKGSCSFCSRKSAWAFRGGHRVKRGDSGGVTFLCSKRPCDALEPILKITSCLADGWGEVGWGWGKGEQWRRVARIVGFGSTPWTMVEGIQSPGPPLFR